MTASENWPSSYDFPKLSGEKFDPDFVFEDVKITRTFFTSHRYEPQPPQTYIVPKMVVTDKRIIFLNSKNEWFQREVSFKRVAVRQEVRDAAGNVISPKVFPSYGLTGPGPTDTLSPTPFWVLEPSANEELDQEFKKNPAAYSKIPGAWWAQGYREWTWVGDLVQAHEGPVPDSGVVEVSRLVHIQAIAQGGPGRFIPTSHVEGTAQLTLKSSGAAERLKDHINGLVKAARESPFSEAYIASQPVKPMTAGYRAYMYAFWILSGAAIPAGVLWGMGIPSWIVFPVVLCGCVAIFCFLRQRGKSAGDRNVR